MAPATPAGSGDRGPVLRRVHRDLGGQPDPGAAAGAARRDDPPPGRERERARADGGPTPATSRPPLSRPGLTAAKPATATRSSATTTEYRARWPRRPCGGAGAGNPQWYGIRTGDRRWIVPTNALVTELRWAPPGKEWWCLSRPLRRGRHHRAPGGWTVSSRGWQCPGPWPLARRFAPMKCSFRETLPAKTSVIPVFAAGPSYPGGRAGPTKYIQSARPMGEAFRSVLNDGS